MREIDSSPGQVFTRAELLEAGLTSRDITRSVRSGELVRARRDRYLVLVDDGIDRAVRVGGRLACVSLLSALSVFVLDGTALHIHMGRTMSRMRHPDDRSRGLDERARTQLRLHWWPLRGSVADLGRVALLDAVAQSVRCQSARAAVATVDSILYLGLMTRTELIDLFADMPRRYAVILRLADGSAESGPETFMRLQLRQLGARYRTQVDISGVGRVDFLVEGWLIIECDSKAHHEGWSKQREDRRRDLNAARLGYATLRPLAEDLFHHPNEVRTAVRGLLRSRRIAAG